MASKFAKFGGGGEPCVVCQKTVYAAEAITFEKRVFHPACFLCTTCRKLCSAQDAGMYADNVYCKQCFTKGGYREKQAKVAPKKSDAPSSSATGPGGGSKFGGGGAPCGLCQATVYPAEAIPFETKLYHPACFKCTTCIKQCAAHGAAQFEDKIYCTNCFAKAGYREKQARVTHHAQKPLERQGSSSSMKFGGGGMPCFVCTKTVYPAEAIPYDGKVFHPNCMKCTTCSKVCTAHEAAMFEDRVYCTRCFAKAGYREKQARVASHTPKNLGINTGSGSIGSLNAPWEGTSTPTGDSADKGPPSVTPSRFGGGGAPCSACAKTVYAAEAIPFDGKVFHPLCLKCTTCGKTCKNASEAAQFEDRVYCTNCFAKAGYREKQAQVKFQQKSGSSSTGEQRSESRFGGGGEKCGNCGKTVYPAEAIPYQKAVYHPECCKCASCMKTCAAHDINMFEERMYCSHCFGKHGFREKQAQIKRQAALVQGGSSLSRQNSEDKPGSASSKFGGGGTPCTVCARTVYPAEAVQFEQRIYHGECLKCCTCKKECKAYEAAQFEDKIYCNQCFAKAGLREKQAKVKFTKKDKEDVTPNATAGSSSTGSSKFGGGGESCSNLSCSKTVYPAEAVIFDGKKYHGDCLKCSTCGKIGKPYDMAQFEDNLLCTQCFQRGGYREKQAQIRRSGSSSGPGSTGNVSNATGTVANRFGGGGVPCTVCRKTVYPAEAIAFDQKIYHAECLTCSSCKKPVATYECETFEQQNFCKLCFKRLGLAKLQADVTRKQGTTVPGAVNDVQTNSSNNNPTPPMDYASIVGRTAASASPTKAPPTVSLPSTGAVGRSGLDLLTVEDGIDESDYMTVSSVSAVAAPLTTPSSASVPPTPVPVGGMNVASRSVNLLVHSDSLRQLGSGTAASALHNRRNSSNAPVGAAGSLPLSGAASSAVSTAVTTSPTRLTPVLSPMTSSEKSYASALSGGMPSPPHASLPPSSHRSPSQLVHSSAAAFPSTTTSPPSVLSSMSSPPRPDSSRPSSSNVNSTSPRKHYSVTASPTITATTSVSSLTSPLSNSRKSSRQASPTAGKRSPSVRSPESVGRKSPNVRSPPQVVSDLQGNARRGSNSTVGAAARPPPLLATGSASNLIELDESNNMPVASGSPSKSTPSRSSRSRNETPTRVPATSSSGLARYPSGASSTSSLGSPSRIPSLSGRPPLASSSSLRSPPSSAVKSPPFVIRRDVSTSSLSSNSTTSSITDESKSTRERERERQREDLRLKLAASQEARARAEAVVVRERSRADGSVLSPSSQLSPTSMNSEGSLGSPTSGTVRSPGRGAGRKRTEAAQPKVDSGRTKADAARVARKDDSLASPTGASRPATRSQTKANANANASDRAKKTKEPSSQVFYL